MRDEGVVVSKKAKLLGKSGAMHEVDVFYEFLRAGVRHRVAVECKDLSRPVEKGDITEFHGKIQDIGGISALVVSRSGYQEGARLYAKHWDVLLLNSDELPILNLLLAARLEAVALPDESYVGEPFGRSWRFKMARSPVRTSVIPPKTVRSAFRSHFRSHTHVRCSSKLA